MKDYNYLEDKFMFNLTEDILLAMEDAGVTVEQAAECIGLSPEGMIETLNGEWFLSIEEILRLCDLCDADIDIVITRNGKNVRKEKA